MPATPRHGKLSMLNPKRLAGHSGNHATWIHSPGGIRWNLGRPELVLVVVGVRGFVDVLEDSKITERAVFEAALEQYISGTSDRTFLTRVGQTCDLTNLGVDVFLCGISEYTLRLLARQTTLWTLDSFPILRRQPRQRRDSVARTQG
jgi:hypothetical protein